MNELDTKIQKWLSSVGYIPTINKVKLLMKTSSADAKQIVDQYITKNPATSVFVTPKSTKIIAGIITLILFVVIIGGCYSCFKDEAVVDNTFKPESFKTKAYVISEGYIKLLLKAPASAEFPQLDAEAFTNYVGDSTFVVNSYVDAQNSFGAQIRSNFFCKLKYKGGDWADARNWEAIDMKLIDR